MVFSSTLFLFVFLPVTLAGYYLLPQKAKNYWLLVLSLLFFGWMQMHYLWIILLNIAVNYAAAFLIDKIPHKKKLVLIIAVICNLAVLFFFKYFDFTLATVNGIFGTKLPLFHILLPIGISFFTFQGMSYMIDVYRGQVEVQKNIGKVALYVVLFPQLIAGPIVRYKDIAAQIDERRVTLADFEAGIERFIRGLAKKTILANNFAVVADGIWFNGAANNTWIIAWIGSIAYTMQIYFDFSGYSDMAIGLGRMFGFRFMENFNLPYISKSVTEFWRRWHISLSSWFKDYVYIPLGGNRKRVYGNLFIVFLLTGIWHGAAWNFILWGLWNFLFILIERLIRKRSRRTFGKVGSLFTMLYTLAVVNFGWVLFRAPNLTEALHYLRAMFGAADAGRVGFTTDWFFDTFTAIIFIVGFFAASSLPKRIAAFLRKKVPETGGNIVKYIALLYLLFTSMMMIVSGSYNPFIYFRF